MLCWLHMSICRQYVRNKSEQHRQSRTSWLNQALRARKSSDAIYLNGLSTTKTPRAPLTCAAKIRETLQCLFCCGDFHIRISNVSVCTLSSHDSIGFASKYFGPAINFCGFRSKTERSLLVVLDFYTPADRRCISFRLLW
jgi:hypothetical protein